MKNQKRRENLKKYSFPTYYREYDDELGLKIYYKKNSGNFYKYYINIGPNDDLALVDIYYSKTSIEISENLEADTKVIHDTLVKTFKKQN